MGASRMTSGQPKTSRSFNRRAEPTPGIMLRTMQVSFGVMTKQWARFVGRVLNELESYRPCYREKV